MEHSEKTLSSHTIFDGAILSLVKDEVQLENGANASREVVRHSGGVAVLAADDEDNILFVRQFRYPTGEVLWELPAGKINKGEDPAKCGLRELTEETGYTCSRYSPLLQIYPTPAYSDEQIHIFLAGGLTFAGQRLDEDEFLTVEKIPHKKALEMCLSGEIKDAKTLAAILAYSQSARRA